MDSVGYILAWIGLTGLFFSLLLSLGSKDLGFYVFRTLMYIVGKPWSKQDV